MALNSSLYTPAEGYTLVFDLRAIEFRFDDLTFVLVFILLAIITLTVYLFKRRQKQQVKKKIHLVWKLLLAVVFLSLCFACYVIAFIEYIEYFSHQRITQKKNCTMLDGAVKGFESTTTGGITTDSFFLYWEEGDESFYLSSDPSYNHPSARLVKKGDKVRICTIFGKYNRIVTLEIKNYKGTVPEYSNEGWKTKVSQWLLFPFVDSIATDPLAN